MKKEKNNECHLHVTSKCQGEQGVSICSICDLIVQYPQCLLHPCLTVWTQVRFIGWHSPQRPEDWHLLILGQLFSMICLSFHKTDLIVDLTWTSLPSSSLSPLLFFPQQLNSFSVLRKCLRTGFFLGCADFILLQRRREPGRSGKWISLCYWVMIFG